MHPKTQPSKAPNRPNAEDPNNARQNDSRPDKKPDAAVDIDDAMIEEVKEDPFKSGESGPANKNARTDHGKTGKR